MPTNRLLTLKISAIASPWPLLLLYSWSSSARKAGKPLQMEYSDDGSRYLVNADLQFFLREHKKNRHFLVIWEGHMTSPKDFWAPPRL